MAKEKEKNNKALLLIGTIIISIMFVSSYVSFGNTPTATTTTTIQQVTGYPVIGYVNSTILGYKNNSVVKLSGQSVNYSGAISGILSKMQSNGSISSYVPLGNQFDVYTVRIDPNGLQSAIRYGLASNALLGINVSAIAIVSLPQYTKLYFHNQSVSVASPALNTTLGLVNPPAVNSSLRLKVFAVVSANGTIISNQFNVSIAK